MVRENTDGLPDVDLGPVIDDLEKQQDQDQIDGKKDDKPRNELGQFKSQEDLLKGYKEVQGFSTKVSQENKELKSELVALKEQQELASFHQPAQPEQTADFDSAWMEDPEKAIGQTVAEQIQLSGIQDVLADEDMKDHGAFQERYAYVNMLSQNPQYAHLSATKQGVKKLFEIGDKLRKEQLKKSTGKALESFFGGPLNEEQSAKLKTLVMGEEANKQKPSKSNAYMPDTTTSVKTDLETDTEQATNAKMEKAVEEGDVDGAVGALFEGILAEEET
jgi:hypothetical protein|tara:strand:+ start:6124 stop:6951 length:828 start_codon:yes stop_codon:yes gene_type:complete